jgi:hypothetical protein
MAVSEFGQLGARRHDPHTARTEIHQQGGVNFDADDPAEAVRIVGYLILHSELLRRDDGWGAEGTSGQEAPGRGVGWLHPSSMRSFLAGCAGLTLAGAVCWQLAGDVEAGSESGGTGGGRYGDCGSSSNPPC